MSFDPVAYTGEDGDEYKILVRRKIRPGDKADKEPGLFGNVELNWTKDDHKMFSGLLDEISEQFQSPTEFDEKGFVKGTRGDQSSSSPSKLPMNRICQNCGLKIVHKAVREWGIDARYLGGLGEMCQECVKQGDIDKSLFPF